MVPWYWVVIAYISGAWFGLCLAGLWPIVEIRIKRAADGNIPQRREGTD